MTFPLQIFVNDQPQKLNIGGISNVANAHIADLLRAPTLRLRHRPRKSLEFPSRLHQQDATFSSDSSRDPASLVFNYFS
jgi:hypothetical protein